MITEKDITIRIEEDPSPAALIRTRIVGSVKLHHMVHISSWSENAQKEGEDAVLEIHRKILDRIYGDALREAEKLRDEVARTSSFSRISEIEESFRPLLDLLNPRTS